MVADAIEEQYLPKFSGDQLPATHVGIALHWQIVWIRWWAFLGLVKYPVALKTHLAYAVRLLGFCVF